MDSTFSRTAENLLFSVLVTACIGWTAVSMADAAGTVTSPAACFAATSAPAAAHS
jgi:hypothetical protein